MGSPTRAGLPRLALHRGRVRVARPHHRSARDAGMSAQPQRGLASRRRHRHRRMLAPGAYMKLGIEGIAPHCLESRAPGVRRVGAARRRDRGRPELRHRLVARAGRRSAGASRACGRSIAPSFGGLYFRNAFNLGLLLLTCRAGRATGTTASWCTLELDRCSVVTADGRAACLRADAAVPARHGQRRRPDEPAAAAAGASDAAAEPEPPTDILPMPSTTSPCRAQQPCREAPRCRWPSSAPAPAA